MTAVVEVGPGTVRGPNHGRSELVSEALDCLDDDLALVGGQAVRVDVLWCEVMRAVAGADVGALLVVCPDWWPAARVDRVEAAARTVVGAVEMRTRTSWLRDGNRRATVVEIAEEFVVISPPDRSRSVVARRDGRGAVADAVAASVATTRWVVVDAAPGVNDADALAEAIADRLRAQGSTVSFGDDGPSTPSVVAPEMSDGPAPVDRRRGPVAVLVGLVSAAVLCGVLASRGEGTPADAATLLIEGRVGVMVPADWTVQRVTSGPGSPRTQVVSPFDDDVVLHITQSAGGSGDTVDATADSLRAALDHEPRGVFVDFNSSDRRAGRPAVTYREIRTGHHVAWSVLLDNQLRIAIGCQSAPGRDHLVREVCERAIGSAQVVH